MANTVALSNARMNGTENSFTKKKVKHTIFLFNKKNAAQVIDEFGQLVLDTFTDEELQVYKREGIHVIGMVHEKKEETKENHFPKGVYDYWVDDFEKWTAEQGRSIEKREDVKTLPNHYVYIDEKTGRMADMEFGSIHSVKGRTHLATLVLETYKPSQSASLFPTHGMQKHAFCYRIGK